MTKMTKGAQTQAKKAVYFVATKYKNRKTRVSFYTKDWKSVPDDNVRLNAGYSLE